MAIPTILSGAAGRALRALEPLAERNVRGLDGLAIVTRATPDIKQAIGSEAGQALAKRVFDATRSGSTRSAASRETIHLALDQLETAAASTARKRVLIGSLALGGGLAGFLALRGAASGGGGQPMAPGPIGDHGSSSGGGTQV